MESIKVSSTERSWTKIRRGSLWRLFTILQEKLLFLLRQSYLTKMIHPNTIVSSLETMFLLGITKGLRARRLWTHWLCQGNDSFLLILITLSFVFGLTCDDKVCFYVVKLLKLNLCQLESQFVNPQFRVLYVVKYT